MNTTTKPGVLAVMDDATMSMDDQKGDDLREARATVERSIDELAAISTELRTRKINHGRAESPTLISWANRIDAALDALRGST